MTHALKYTWRWALEVLWLTPLNLVLATASWAFLSVLQEGAVSWARCFCVVMLLGCHASGVRLYFAHLRETRA